MNVLESLTHPSAWAVHVVDPPLESYVGKGLRGRVALLGDAAHGMLPHLGAGAGQGMEDVYALVRLLWHPQVSRDNVEVRSLKGIDSNTYKKRMRSDSLPPSDLKFAV